MSIRVGNAPTASQNGTGVQRSYLPWRRRRALQGARILLSTEEGHKAEVEELLDRQTELGVTLIRSNPSETLCFDDERQEKGLTHVAVSGGDGLPANVVDVTLGGGPEVMALEDLYEWLTGKLPRAACAQGPGSILSRRRFGDRLQRLFSFVAASVGLLLTVPFYPIIAAAIWIDDPGNVFFKQERLGWNGGRFTLIKFRTMRSSPRDGRAGAWMKVGLPDAELDRVTRVGAFMRRHRVDELPQLWNVLTGDLNAVGPRAETPRAFEERAKGIEGYGSRLVVVPGMAGWGLLNEYSDMYAKLQYDMYYIKHRSFRFDLYIFVATALRITLGTLK
jgi:lipopolysaccharide/colanic/teichoic acid biosynthesis glycosyltransferase